MAGITDENLNFVCLIEEFKEILEKSQAPSAKKKKEEAAALLIEKWTEISGKQLTLPSLLKKITNFKVRAKSAFNKGAKLTSWQTKLLEITKEDNEEQQSDRAVEPKHESSCSSSIEEVVVIAEIPAEAQNLLDRYETEETKTLSNDQLQRIIFLQQIQVLELQKKKLENDVNIPNQLFDISGLNVSGVLNANNN